MLRRSAPLRRTPLKRTRMRPKPKIAKTPDMKTADAEFWQAQRSALYARSGGRCERCGCDLNRTGLEAHHRKLRSQGGLHDIWNLAALCPRDHREVHANPRRSKDEGFIVAQPCDPAVKGLMLHDGRTVLLTEFGGYFTVFPS